jgi:Polysaccharide lyase
VGGGSGSAGAGTGGGPLGTIYFSNDGTTIGWSSARPQSNTIGKVTDVTNPVFKTSTAILTEQTYVAPQGAHSEVILANAQRNGEDKYYGQAIYLPLDWNTIDKNSTFQQFSPEAPEGPWMLNWVQNDHIFIRAAGKTHDCGPISKGVWTRVVVRFKTTNPGIFEYWVDGVKKQSVTNVDMTILNGSPSMRWSTGIYVTWWRDQPPGPQLTRQIFHDQLRVASTYEDADPANWGP